MKTYNGHDHIPGTAEFGMYQDVNLDVYGTLWTCKIVDMVKDDVTLEYRYQLKCRYKPHYSGVYSGHRIVESVYYVEQEDY